MNYKSPLICALLTLAIQVNAQEKVNWWLSNSDKSALLAKQKAVKFREQSSLSSQVDQLEKEKYSDDN